MTSTFVSSVQQQNGTQEITSPSSPSPFSSAVVSELPADYSEVSLLVAINGLQASINRFIDVFEKCMSTLGDTTPTCMSQAVRLVQEVDDGLSDVEKVHLIEQFIETPTMAEAYLAMTNPRFRRAWIHTNLTSQPGIAM